MTDTMTLEQVRSNMRDAMYNVLQDDTRRMVNDWYNAIDAAILDRDADRFTASNQTLRAERAEAELAALKARIAEAPIIHAEKTWRGTLFVNLSQRDVDLLDGKRVRLVVEE